MPSMFNDLKTYLDSIPIGGIIERKYMIDHIGKIDNYRRSLELLGYLKKGYREGVYIKVKEIPSELSTTIIEKLKYSMNHNKRIYLNTYNKDKNFWEQWNLYNKI